MKVYFLVLSVCVCWEALLQVSPAFMPLYNGRHGSRSSSGFMGRCMDNLGRGNAQSIIGAGSFAYCFFCGLGRGMDSLGWGND